ncbi:hypothetical protein O6H91_01G054200 [Diphasiastrum complanatum]|uniref:Uncharacterized protein n=2 Tax=Diphasiastrum complanatum TaxID=34168 RepID=A0ACC2ER08_DIPCM|nr:hypothetical protein O6H91_01G054200 [Diphasiastrum complanatum]KAJ7568950.1 hypothetical protein O6H91_01G054200 [Diphasiastrum complanatum]
MGSRMKDDEKHEKIVRGLAKLEHNRRCINCAALGPQYVCTNFSIFVCTNCSGIHREFTHRVKSISMAKFTATEVAALQAGGNQRAKEMYLQDWDPQRHPLPDSSYPEKIRDFIKAVYVDKRFAADRPVQKSRQGGREELSNLKRPDSRPDSNPGSWSPVTENRFDDHRHSNRPTSQASEDWSYEDRASSFEDKRSPGKFEANRGRYEKNERERRYEDRFANEGSKNLGKFEYDRSKSDRSQYSDRERQFEDHFSSDVHDSRWSRDRPPNHRSYGNESSPPVRSVREILGEDVPRLCIEGNTRANTRLKSTGSLGSSTAGPFRDIPTQRSVSFGNGGMITGSVAGSISGTASLFKRANSDSLIDFSAEPGPPATTVKPDLFVVSPLQPTAENSSTGWASFDPFPSAAPNTEAFPPSGAMYEYPVLYKGSNGGVGELATATASAGHNWQPDFQRWSSAYPSSSTHLPDQATQLSVELGPHPVQAPSFAQSQETQIPQDLLAPSYTQASFMNMGMHIEPIFSSGGPQLMSQGLEVGLQGFGQRPKSKNPFDLPEDVQSTLTNFPNMATLQATLPNLHSGPFAALGMNSATQQYSHMGPTADIPPASYFPGALPGGSGSSPSSLNLMLPSLQHQSTTPVGPDNVGGYQAGPSIFTPAYGFSGQSASQISQNPQYSIGGNPFA